MEKSHTKTDDDSNPKKDQTDTDASLSLSITPPLLDDNKKDNEVSDESISEHLTSNNTSIENDRSFQEIEISNRPSSIFLNLPSSDEEGQHISQEQRPRSLETSFYSDDSVISLNYLDRISFKNMEMNANVRSILDEILNDDQFVSGNEDSGSFTKSKEESLNIFANLDLDDRSLTNFRNSDSDINEKHLYGGNFGVPLLRNVSDVDKRVKDFEELIAIKDSTIAALTSELDSFRELSNTNSASMVSTTEYKQLQEECHNKLMEYNSAIIYKNDLIQQLSESLDQSVNERRELLKQVDVFKEEIFQLQKQLQETSKMVNDHKCVEEVKQVATDEDKGETEISQPVCDLELEFSALETHLSPVQNNLLNDLKNRINEFIRQSVMKNRNLYEEEITKLKESKEDYEAEISKLRGLLANIKCGSTEIMELKGELEAKHSREMEELRMYFEKKCVDLEKNYSEEIFSQQSRKLSGSTSSEAELNSDIAFSHLPGPQGDVNYNLQPNLTKKDLTNLKNELSSVLSKIGRYNLEEISEEELNALKSDIAKCDLNNLLKYDLSVIRNDLQNKYHAELEVLREDGENRVDLLNVEHEKRLRSLEEKYMEEIDNLRCQIDELGRQNLSVSSAVQEVASSGEFEITEVIQSYERRLQQQVTMAKIDIISALESQIQRLASNEADDEEWPSELLQLRDRFTDKYESKIKQMKDDHQAEIEKVKEEHLRVLNGALERARRRSLRDGDSLGKGDLEILKERDNLKHQVASLRSLLSELLKYFTQCEDELNNTLVDELLRQGFDKNLSQIEDELNLNDSSATNSSSLANVTRVHITPNFGELISLIEGGGTGDDCESRDVSVDLKNELGVCLVKLKQEANAILALTTNMARSSAPANAGSLEEKVSSMTRQLISEAQAKERLGEELRDAAAVIETLERQREELEAQLDQVIAKDNVLEEELARARGKIAELIENGHKEIVSEGYGEKGSVGMQDKGDSMTILADLQDKARNMLAQSRASADPTLLHLIEELCRVGERIKEEAQKERADLLLQIDAADKKYRTTQQFLEEQAAEREMERDEAQKNINRLREQLKDRERDKASCERFNDEVEQLEQQLQEMTRLVSEGAKRCKDVEAERNEAVDKIKVLRDIIRELELQIETKTKEVEECLEAIQKLECIVEQQHAQINDARQNDSLKDVSDIGHLRRHIESLEGELQRSRVNAELAGSEGALAQIRTQLSDFEVSLDKKTRELETLHSTGTNCSSPSEDISARDLVQHNNPETMDECEVPLQQLARLKEKLLRHSRAEESAVKRIRDLEMQVFSLKNELEESNGEKDCMNKQIQEQLVLLSDIQIRLDEQRLRADHIEKQTNTSLELKIYDLQNEIDMLRDKLQTKEKALAHQQVVLSETQKRLKTLEEEMSLNGKEDDDLLVTMQKELEGLRVENAQLKQKMSNEAQIVPNLVENIISDKNVDIEKLREKLEETEKLLESYTSLNLDRRELQTISNLKNHGTSLEEVLGILDLSEAERARKINREESGIMQLSQNLDYKRNVNETVFIGSTSEPEISTIEKEGRQHFSSAPGKTNSTEIYKSGEKRVHFEDTDDIERLNGAVSSLKQELEAKDKVIAEYEERLQLLCNLEEKIEKLQLSLEQTEKALATATETFEREQRDAQEREKNLGVELAEKRLQLSEKEKKIEVLERDSHRKDELCLELADQKRDLEQELLKFKSDSFRNLDTIINEKNAEIETLTASLQNVESLGEEVDSLKQELEEKEEEATSLQRELNKLARRMEEMAQNNKDLGARLRESNEENAKLRKEKQNNAVQMESAVAELNNLREKLNKKRRAIKDLEDVVDNHLRSIEVLENQVKYQKEIIVDRECEIEIANEDAKRYQNDIASLEDRIKHLEDELQQKLTEEKINKEKDSKIEELDKERMHLQELLNEKDKIISQISEDSHKLHVNLVTIQAKLKETGSIIDLGNKLKEEQKKTADLVGEIHNLKAQLMQYEALKKNSNPMTASVDDIADQVKKELDYSAQIDTNILNAVSDHSLTSISDSQDAEIYKKALAKEKSTRKQLVRVQDQLKKQVLQLEEKCASLQALNDNLRSCLENERLVLYQTQVEDAKLIEQLRVQLDTVLDKEEVLEKLLEEEKATKKQLASELETVRFNNGSSGSKTESTEYRALPSKEVMDLNQLRRDFDKLREENSRLLTEVTLLKQAKGELEAGCKYSRDMLALEAERTKGLEAKVQALVESEMKLREALLQKKIELEKKLHEVESNKIAMDEMEQEKALLSKQKTELTHRLNMQALTGPIPPQSAQVPDVLMDKIKELNNALLDNKKLVDIIQRLTTEKRTLETELSALKNCKTPDLPFDDLVARSDYLFAKTLRLESVKKALIWQKRYLLDYLQGHQRHCLIEALPHAMVYRNKFTPCHLPRQRFRSVVFVVVSIARMKFLVTRWHSGRRIAEKVNSRHHRHVSGGPAETIPAARFHLGQPVSSQFFTNNAAGTGNFVLSGPGNYFPAGQVENAAVGCDDGRVSPASSAREQPPWSGSTPPSKEGSLKRRIKIGSQVLSREDMTPLRAPQLLAQFVERFDQIQEKLGVVLDSNAT